ncbi:MAG TPA: hypothetical protein VMU40_07765 [Steroidobacteraceae bacterium]|nr:hypothetical protein [Steroidobacteraceae bacterium]
MPELPPEARAEIDERRAEVACLQSAIETIDRELSELEERRSYAVRRVDAATEGVRQAALSLLAERLYSAADYTEAAIIEFERRLIHTSAIKAVLDAESWDRVRNGNVAEAGFRAYAVANRVTSLRSRLQRPTASEVLEVAKEEVEALLAALINQEKSE